MENVALLVFYCHRALVSVYMATTCDFKEENKKLLNGWRQIDFIRYRRWKLFELDLSAAFHGSPSAMQPGV
jgi:hypothetical protein